MFIEQNTLFFANKVMNRLVFVLNCSLSVLFSDAKPFLRTSKEESQDVTNRRNCLSIGLRFKSAFNHICRTDGPHQGSPTGTVLHGSLRQAVFDVVFYIALKV